VAIAMGEKDDPFDEAGFRGKKADLVAAHQYATISDAFFMRRPARSRAQRRTAAIGSKPGLSARPTWSRLSSVAE
jgi:hypothetical protein